MKSSRITRSQVTHHKVYKAVIEMKLLKTERFVINTFKSNICHLIRTVVGYL